MRTTVLALLSKSLPPVLTPAAVVRQAYSKEGFKKQSVAALDNAAGSSEPTQKDAQRRATLTRSVCPSGLQPFLVSLKHSVAEPLEIGE